MQDYSNEGFELRQNNLIGCSPGIQHSTLPPDQGFFDFGVFTVSKMSPFNDIKMRLKRVGADIFPSWTGWDLPPHPHSDNLIYL